MSLAETLWQRNADLAHACRDHPFVVGLASGTLAKSTFVGYVAQDAYFLDAFARAYAVAAAKAPDSATFRAFYDLAGGVLDELRLHAAYADTLGINLAATRPLAATRRYFDFLLATAWSAPPGLTTAAMTPCMRLYAFLGGDLARDGVPDHQYGDWIRVYSSPAFEALASRLEDLLDRLAAPGEDVAAAYRYAMECELAFFQAAWEAGLREVDQ